VDPTLTATAAAADNGGLTGDWHSEIPGDRAYDIMKHCGAQAFGLGIIRENKYGFYLKIQIFMWVIDAKKTYQNATMRINGIKYIQGGFGDHFMVYRRSRIGECRVSQHAN
jgi:hypothetical protein